MRSIVARLVSDRAAMVAGALLTAFVLLEAGSLRHMTLTKDEGGHYAYGWQILHLDTKRLDNSKMPFSAFNALPRKVASLLAPGPLQRRLSSIEFGRWATVVATVLLGWLVFHWARQLYGPPGGLLSLALFVFDPNILAHGSLVTTDLYATGMIALAVWTFWRFLNHEGPGAWRAAAVAALAFAAAQLAKYTSTYLVPILLMIAAGYAAPELWTLARAGRWRTILGRFAAAGRYAALYVVAFLLVVNLGYWGQRTLRPLEDCEFRSDMFRAVQASLARVPGLRVPVPWAYVEGLDWVLADERSEKNNVYMLGHVGQGDIPGHRFPAYYAVAWLFKVPIATQVLLLLALVFCAIRFRRFDFRRNELFLACPVLFFAWYLTFVFNTQIGFRYALVVVPFLLVFTGSLVRDAATVSRGRWVVVGGLLIYLVVSVLSYYPHFIPYFNELVWDRKKAYRVLADSNLGWSQNHWYLRRYLQRHPDAVLDPVGPQTGTVVLSVDKFVGLTFAERYRWLRENFEPVGHIAHGHLIFRVTPEALRRVTDPLPADWGDKED